MFLFFSKKYIFVTLLHFSFLLFCYNFRFKMKFAIQLKILFSNLFSKQLTNLQREHLDLFVKSLSCYLISLSALVTVLYQEKKCFLYSTGKDSFDDFSSDLTTRRKLCNVWKRVQNTIHIFKKKQF